MFKFLAATSVAIYAVLIIFGDEARRPEVARQASDDVTGLTLAAFSAPATTVEASGVTSELSEREAVRIALDAGRTLRAERKSAPLRGKAMASVEAATTAEQAAAVTSALDIWYVTGTQVNLRSGPGTGNVVIGGVGLGDSAEVLASRDGWYQIRSGSTEGWIFGKFLSQQKPG